MKNLKKDLQAISKQLDTLSKKIETMIVAAGESQKSKAFKAKTAKRTVAKKEKKMTAPETILSIIKSSKSKKGVAIVTLKEKTGFQGQKLYNVLSMLKKKGKVKNPSKGVYVKG